VTIMQKVAALLGKTDDEKMYQRLGEDIRKAYIKKYMDSTTGKIDRNSQTANAISLSVGLVDAQDTAKIMRNLIEDIRGRNNALTAGDVGFSYLLHTLSDHGRSDIIYDMNSKYDVPGYGWQLAHGATALTESWQAYKSVSNNHFMLGHLMEWFYSGIGGIRQSESSVAFDDIIIDPQIVGDLTSASVSYESPHGTIRSEWKLEGDDYVLHVSIPANTRASIYLPQDDANCISNFGMPISADKDMNFKAIAPGKSCVNVGSGDYQFLMKNSKADGSSSSHNK
jgi:alpha-L-rhamnosidase